MLRLWLLWEMKLEYMYLEIGIVSLLLTFGHFLILKYEIYVSFMRRKFICVLDLDKCGWTFNFDNGKLVVCFKSIVLGSGILHDGLYILKMDKMTVNVIIGSKRGRRVESYSMME